MIKQKYQAKCMYKINAQENIFYRFFRINMLMKIRKIVAVLKARDKRAREIEI